MYLNGKNKVSQYDIEASDGIVELLLNKGANPNMLTIIETSQLSGLLFWWDETKAI